jgi:GMP synthase (glutamine-hydrolysing)
MLNHRLINPPKEPEEFIDAAIEFLRKYAIDKKVFCALSGGIDSSTTYLLLKKAEINVIPVFIDHGLMRIINGKEEKEIIKDIFPEIVIINIRDEFLPKIYDEGEAEKKRLLFKDAYSSTISKFIKDNSCDVLADGTILPDIEESFGVKISDLEETMSLNDELALKEKYKEGFIKSQHNLEIEYDVEATVQPVASLTKHEIRNILKYLNMPQELIYRKAFPGPALAARIIGPITPENLDFEKKVHDIVENCINTYYNERYGKAMIINEQGEQEPFQGFAAIGEDVLLKKVTGMVEGKRTYEIPLSIKGEWDFKKLTTFASHLQGYARLLYELHESNRGTFDVIIRSVNSIDARKASVTDLPIHLLEEIKFKLLELSDTKNIYFDITPKPPATIEYV